MTTARPVTPMLVAAAVAAGVMVAVVGWTSLRRHRRSAWVAEAPVMLQAIAGAEHIALASRLAHLGCPGGDYPRAVPDPNAVPWSAPGHSGEACWRTLSVSPAGPVRFVYQVAAGGPTDPVPTPPKSGLTMPTPTGPWFVAMASADLDGDGIRSSWWLTSFSPGVGSVDPEE